MDPASAPVEKPAFSSFNLPFHFKFMLAGAFVILFLFVAMLAVNLVILNQTFYSPRYRTQLAEANSAIGNSGIAGPLLQKMMSPDKAGPSVSDLFFYGQAATVAVALVAAALLALSEKRPTTERALIFIVCGGVFVAAAWGASWIGYGASMEVVKIAFFGSFG